MTVIDKTLVLPSIPAKRYFTIGEVGDLCGVKPHVLRYWEQEFTQLKPVKRREVLLIRKIRELLYEQGFTISGARNKLGDGKDTAAAQDPEAAVRLTGAELQALRTELTDIAKTLSVALGSGASTGLLDLH
jgi:DNA-binding transcriptional MerR regulator